MTEVFIWNMLRLNGPYLSLILKDNTREHDLLFHYGCRNSHQSSQLGQLQGIMSEGILLFQIVERGKEKPRRIH